MWPSSWDCLSPDTCVRCATNTADNTCLYNKFTCLCDTDNSKNGQRIPCLHQEIIDEHKSKLAAQASGSTPGISGVSNSNKKTKRKQRRKSKQEKLVKLSYPCASTSYDDDALETKNLLDNTPDSGSAPPTPELRLNLDDRSSSSSSTNSSSSTTSSSSGSSSSSNSNSSDSSSSSSSNSNSSSTQSDSYNAHRSDVRVTKKASKRRYVIMEDSSANEVNDCDNNDNEKDGTDDVESSDDESSADSTSASSDDSWWQRYEQLKDMPFLQKGGDAMKDSGYVSTTSPNTDSTKTDD